MRGAQALSARAERAGLSRLSRMPSDRAFFRLLAPTRDGRAFESAEAWLENFRRRESPHFFAGFDDESATREALRPRFDDGNVIERAERVLKGSFDLLGLRGLDFGSPVDWHLEPLARVRAPLVHWSRIDFLDPKVSGDKKFVWELNRHQFFQTLGRAYWRTGDERFAEGFARHAAEWAGANPPKLGVNWASSLEVAFRSISWLWALHFFRSSPSLTPRLFLVLSKFLYLKARHLETYLSTYFSPNTHLTGEALGLYYLGTLLPEFGEAARWRATGRRILLAELDRHVRPDGVYFEQSTYYQRYTADFYTHFALLARANGDDLNGEGFGARVAQKLTALLDHLMYLTRPDGTTPFVGDDDGGRLVALDERQPDDFRAALSNGAALFGRADYKFVAGVAPEETLWLFGPEGLERFDSLDAREPVQHSRAFTDGGYYVMRDGWDAGSNYMLLDCGPHGAREAGFGHAHADALSFDLAARGRTLLVDPGTHTYTGSREERDRFRSTAAHNALTVDGESSSVPGDGPFKWASVARAKARRWISSRSFDFFEGSHDGYKRLDAPVDYARAVLFVKGDYWVVLDRVRPAAQDARGGGGAEHLYETHFHFAPGAEPSLEERGEAFALRVSGESALEILAPRRDGSWERGAGWVSRCYGAREAAAVCTRSLKTDRASDSFAFVLPQAAGSRGDARLLELEAEGGRAFELRRGGWRDLLLVGARERTEVRTSRAASSFGWAWLRFAEETGALEEFFVVGDGKLSLDGREVVNALEAGLPWHHSARRVGEGWDADAASASRGEFKFIEPNGGGGQTLADDRGGDELEEVSSYVRD